MPTWRATFLDLLAPFERTQPVVAAATAALAYAEAGRLQDAETALRLAVERDPRFDRAWYNLGLLLAQTGRLPEAIEALNRAEQIAPQEVEYPFAAATIWLQRDNRDAALEAAKRALVIDPTHAQARKLLGQ